MWIAFFVYLTAAAILYRTAACGSLRRLEASRTTSEADFRRAVVICRIEGTVGAIACLAMMIGSPYAALGVDGEEGLAIVLLLASGFLFWLSLRLCVWGWRTRIA